jgi:hypothetical protein
VCSGQLSLLLTVAAVVVDDGWVVMVVREEAGDVTR